MKELYREELTRTGEIMLEATAYGDAAGLPVEKMNRGEIYVKYGYLSELVSPEDHPFFSNEFEPGVWSDDTRFSTAVAEGLVAADGFDLHAQAEQLVRAYHDTPKVMNGGRLTPRGWGDAHTNSAERLMRGVAPEHAGEESASGNGVLIKLAPLVFWQVARGTEEQERHAQYDALTVLTHDSPVAKWATRVHGDFLHHVLVTPEEELYLGELARLVFTNARKHEATFGIRRKLSCQMEFLTSAGLAHEPDLMLMHTDRKGFYAPQTLAMAYGAVILCMQENFGMTVYEAVNLGGDADSIAPITANILNFMDKGDIILPEDATLLQERERLQRVSHSLTHAALKGA